MSARCEIPHRSSTDAGPVGAAGRARAIVAGLAVVALVGGTGCGPAAEAVPGCGSLRRLAVVAQAVPTASYVPCLDDLEEGWTAEGFDVRRGRAEFRLEPGRAGGRAVEVVLSGRCDVVGAVPTRPRAEGVRTSIRLASIAPRYAGTLADAFPGGCVTYRFDFRRGPHIPLMEELQSAVALLSRQQLRLELRRELDVELDP